MKSFFMFKDINLRLLLFEILQASFKIVVSCRFSFEIGINLSNLFADYVSDVTQRLLYRILGHVPLESCYIRW